MGGVSLFLHRLLQQIDVSLNDQQVSQSAGTYAYRAYIESLISCEQQAKTSKRTVALYYKDTADNMDRPNLDARLRTREELWIAELASLTDRDVTDAFIRIFLPR